MQQFRFNRYRLIFAALYALAMSFVGFAHQPLPLASATAQVTEAELAAYALPDGTLPSLCLNSGGDGEAPVAFGLHCDACLITAAAGLPTGGSDGLRLPVSRQQQSEIAPLPPLLAAASPRANTPRAPPALFGIADA